MEQVIKIEDFHIKLQKNNVYELIDCKPDSPVFEEVEDEYDRLEAFVYDIVKPRGVIIFGNADPILENNKIKAGVPVLYALCTIGREVSELSTTYFAQGDYLCGMMIDAMADNYLFQVEAAMGKTIKEECATRLVGVASRLEAPVDVPMEAQKVVYEATNAKEILGVGITESYMIDPVKSNCFILELTSDTSTFRIQHDCRKCNAFHCKLRNIPPVQIKVLGLEEFYIECNEKENILQAMTRYNSYLSAICGGRGTCGKCKIQVLDGELEITTYDENYFTKEELEEGYRLSCKAYPQNDLVIRLFAKDESQFEVLSSFSKKSVGTTGSNESKGDIDSKEDIESKGHIDSKEDMNSLKNNKSKDNTQDKETIACKSPADTTYVIAIDIGTTTIAVQLVGRESHKVIKNYTTINRQRAYGADVITRIQASNTGKGMELQHSIRNDLLVGIKRVVEDSAVPKEAVKKIAIGGNTTMGHLLMGYSCKNLGVSPFTPVNIDLIEERFEDIMGDSYLDVPVLILPGISTFVGGDIVAGLLACKFYEIEKPSMLIDLGTNGEMAVGNKDKILCTSTAAGPAFEGGNMECGTGSVSGAICKVTMKDIDHIDCETINNGVPVGICGTGIIEITSELLEHDLLEDAGLMDEDLDGVVVLAKDANGSDIVFTQKDVREIQLAKSAVRAGIETLLVRYGISYDEVEHVYLAGGFGYKIDIKKAISIGLLPGEFEAKIEAVGNGSLGGAIDYLLDKDAARHVEDMVNHATEINLGSDKDFNDFYMDYMFFE